MIIHDHLIPPVESLLDVGCNVGAWLCDCARRFPAARLAGIELNAPALEIAKRNVPQADLRHGAAEELPFADASFQYVTFLEVLEHLPASARSQAFREIRRVLRPGGRLILSVPHAGWFAWLDSNNIRLRLPGGIRRRLGRGLRDSTYESAGRALEWHHHFTLEELQELAGDGWRRVDFAYGGLFLVPVADWLSWPFYRLKRADHFLRRSLERMSAWDLRKDFGRASYSIMLALDRDG